MPSGAADGRRRLDVEDAAPVRQHERDHVLRHAVFENLELLHLEIRNELIARVAHDHVGRDEIDGDAKRGLLRRAGRRALRRHPNRGAAAQRPPTPEISGLFACR